MFTTYADGGQTHTQTVQLPFDPTAGFHECRFDCLDNPETARASVTFYVDGKEMRTWDTGVPRPSMHLMLNTWFRSWFPS
jgi:endo-1,3-1,4-beta-glycanase ExoK